MTVDHDKCIADCDQAASDRVERGQDRRSLDVTFPGGKVSARGYDLSSILLGIIAIVLTIIGMLLANITITARADAAALAALTQTTAAQVASQQALEHNKLHQALERYADAMQEQSYILTLSPKAREALQLDMPLSLRKRARW